MALAVAPDSRGQQPEPPSGVNGFVQWSLLSTDNGDLEIPTGPDSEQTATLILDINDDGLNDFVIADRNQAPSLVWYRRHQNGWSKYVIEDELLFIEAGGAFFDIDGDGDPDIVEGGDSRSDEMWWWENPAPDFNPTVPWTRRLIKQGGPDQHHDCIFGDFDGDGQSELVFWNPNTGSPTLNIAEIPDDPHDGNLWPYTAFYTTSGLAEGLAIADIDGNGVEDLVAGGYWFEHVSGTDFIPHAIDPTQAFTRAAVGQLVPGGRPEVVFVIGDSKPTADIDGKGPLKWYQWNGTSWDAQELLPFDTDHGHSLELADFNADGHLDIFSAEMDLRGNTDATARIFYGDGQGGFELQEVAVGVDNHESTVGDLDGDGDIDILGKPFDDSPGINIWLNGGAPLGTLPLDQWQRHSVDPSQPWLAVFALPGDLDGDGLTDIASGGWWYRNTGDYSSWTRTPIGAPLNNVALLRDFDRDGDLDILGTSGQTQTPVHPGPPEMHWAVNDGLGNFTILSNITPGNATDPDSAFVQGIYPAQFTPGGPEQIALSWNFGEFGESGIDMLTVPANPTQGVWPLETISDVSEGEELDAADLDQDGDLDLFQGTGWLRNDGDSWTRITVTDLIGHNDPYDDPDRVKLADVDGDGDLDAVVGLLFETAATPVDLVWLEQPADPESQWPLHVVAGGIWGGFSLSVEDMNNDGAVDIVLGEHVGLTRLLIFENGGDGSTWTQHIADAGGDGIDHHDGALTVDFDGDGDFDIVSVGWHNQKVWLFENHAVEPGEGGIPGVPSDVTAVAVSSARVDLTWKRTPTDLGLITYQVLRDGEHIGTTSFRQFSDLTTSELTTYEYSVIATTSAGASEPSEPVAVTTPAYDGIPPSAPPGLSADVTTPTSMTLSWEAATDNIGVVSYVVQQDGVTVATQTGLSLQLAGLPAGSDFVFTVAALDAQGNASQPAVIDVSTPPIVSGLWAAWSFEETSGPQSFDSSGNGNDGLLQSGAGRTGDGYFGSALTVSGSGGGVDLGALDIFSDELTIMGWFKADGLSTSDARLISKATGTAEHHHYWMVSTFKLASGNYSVRFRLKTKSGITDTLIADSGSVSVGSWHHVAASYDGSAMRLYLDGAPVGSLPKSGPIAFDPSVGAAIGANPGGDKAFDGTLDEVRIYGSALSLQEIQQAMGSPISGDSAAPSVPANVSAAALSASAVDLSWAASTDDIGVAGYRVFRDGTEIAVTADPSYTDTGLEPATSYTYEVEAFDLTGNRSGPSASVQATTAPDQQPPSAPSALTATPSSPSQIELSWQPSTDNVGVAEYRVFRDGAEIGSTTTPAFSDSGLASGTEYAYTVAALDAAGNLSSSPTVFATTLVVDDEPPSAPANLQASATSPTSVSAAWDAATDDIGVVGYAVYLGGALAVIVDTTTAELSGLSPGTTFTLSVRALDAVGNESAPAAVGVTTPLPQTELVGAWGFEEEAGSAVAADSSGFGRDGALEAGIVRAPGYFGGGVETNGVAGHVDLGAMDPFQDQLTIMLWVNANDFGTYDARLVSKSSSESEQDHVWMVSTFRHERLRFRLKTSDGTTSTLVASSGSLSAGQWHHVAATYDGAAMRLFLDGTEVGARAKTGSVAVDPTLQAWLGANPGSPNQVIDAAFDEVKFFDTALDAAQIADEMSTPVPAAGPPDTSPPSIPANLAAAPLSESQVDLSWSASNDDSGVAGYSVRRDGVEIATTTGLTYSDVSLSPDTTYAYTVEAFDASGNYSGQSLPVEVATLPDLTPPSAPDAFSALALGDSEIQLSWSAATDNLGVAGYRVLRDGSEIANTVATSFTDAGLLPGTAYSYRVEAFDAAGNTSEPTPATVVTTPVTDDEPPTPPVIGTAVASSPTTIDLGWSASTDNLAVAGYRVYLDGVVVATTTSTVAELTGLTASSSYSVAVSAFDQAGNQSDPAAASVVVETPTPQTQLVGAWGFEESAGDPVAQDASGFGHDGLLEGGAVRAAGYLGGGVETNGVAGHVNLGAIDPFADQLTIMAWVKPEGFGTYDARIVSKSTSSASQDHVWMLSMFKQERLRFRLRTSDGTTSTLIATTGSLQRDTWHHVAATYDGAAMRLYLDGTEVGSLAKTGSVAQDPSVEAWLGANPGEPRQVFDGYVDELKFFGSALSAADIASEMANPVVTTP